MAERMAVQGFSRKRFSNQVSRPRGGHQGIDRRVRRPHRCQRLFGRNPTIHHPGAPAPAVLGLDPLVPVRQRGLVAGIPRQHFIGQRQSVRGHHPCNYHLHTIALVIPAVLIVLLLRFGRVHWRGVI